MTRKTVGRWLRRVANRIDPQPTFRIFEPETTTTGGSVGRYNLTLK